MASITTFPTRAIDKDVIIIAGQVERDGTKGNGYGFTSSYSATGLYDIVFTDSFPTFLGAQACIEYSTIDDKIVQVNSFTANTKTLVFGVWDVGDGAAAQIPATGVLHFVAFFKNS